MGRVTKKFLFWSPRILGILFALFLSLFALDVFSEGLNIADAILAFLIHLIPTYIVFIIVFISCNRDDIGVILFFALALFYIVSGGEKHWILLAPMLVISFLFLIGYIMGKVGLSKRKI